MKRRSRLSSLGPALHCCSLLANIPVIGNHQGKCSPLWPSLIVLSSLPVTLSHWPSFTGHHSLNLSHFSSVKGHPSLNLTHFPPSLALIFPLLLALPHWPSLTLPSSMALLPCLVLTAIENLRFKRITGPSVTVPSSLAPPSLFLPHWPLLTVSFTGPSFTGASSLERSRQLSPSLALLHRSPSTALFSANCQEREREENKGKQEGENVKGGWKRCVVAGVKASVGQSEYE